MSLSWEYAEEIVKEAVEQVRRFPEDYEKVFPAAPPAARKVKDDELIRYVDMQRELHPPAFYSGPAGRLVYESPWVLAAAYVHGMRKDVERYFELIGTPDRWRELFPAKKEIRRYERSHG